MKLSMRILQGLKLAAVLAMALSMSACANSHLGANAMAGAATPGSAQDFVVNVGDRVFFTDNQTDLTPQATSALDKQAQWLRAYPSYTFTIEGHADERGMREAVAFCPTTQDGVFNVVFRTQTIATVDIRPLDGSPESVHDVSEHPSTISPV